MKRFPIILLLVLLLLQSCGLAIRENREEIEKMDIFSTYRLALKYYSEGLVDEAEFLYREAINKYSISKVSDDETKKVYFWAIYEVAFINYTKGNYSVCKEYLEKLFSEAGSNTKLAQVVLGKKLYSKIKDLLKQ